MGVSLLTDEGTCKEGEPHSQGPNVAMARLGDCHGVHSGHQHKGHDHLPQEQLALSNGDSSFMSKAAWHAVPTTNCD